MQEPTVNSLLLSLQAITLEGKQLKKWHTEVCLYACQHHVFCES